MARIDLAMSTGNEGGDLLLTPSVDGKVDLALSYDNDTIKQIVYARLKTQAPDWFLHRDLGGNLEDLIGEPNTRETAMRGVELIQRALIYGDFLSITDFSVRPVPISHDEIVFIIKINAGRSNITIPIQFNYEYGMTFPE